MRVAVRLAAVSTVWLLAVAACGGPPRGAAPSPSPRTATSSPGVPTPGAATSPPATTAPSAATPPAAFGYQPLYPFASVAEATAWQASSGSGQSWHLSADQTALHFTQGYLGFTDIDRVVAHTVSGADARVTVGAALPGGGALRAAVIHLVRIGAGASAPWEVAGTDDTTLTVDAPGYGAAVSSPVRVGGKITGVDESIGVEARRLGAGAPAGEFCCAPAGGQSSPWSVALTFHASPGQVITIVAHTGGHVANVERFAVTGVRVRG